MLILAAVVFLSILAPSVLAIDGGTPRIAPSNGWKAIEVISAGEGYGMPTTFDGVGAYPLGSSTVRVLVNHETSDASISQVDLDITNVKQAISNMIANDNPGGVSFVLDSAQAYMRWSGDGGATWTATSSNSNTNFYRFCSAQSYNPNTFGPDRGFVDYIYITGEEGSTNRLFALDLPNRDLYLLSGVAGSAQGGIGGMPFDAFENAALMDTFETNYVALVLSPDGGSQILQLYIGEKGKESDGTASNSFLARNGLAYGSWYYFIGSLPTASSSGGFSTSSSGALMSTKLEDVDTSIADPTKFVLGDQDSGVFTFDLTLDFSGGVFNAGSSSFTVTRIASASQSYSGQGTLNSADNVDWTDSTTLGSSTYSNGLIFVNEDNIAGEIWQILPNGTQGVLVGQTTTGAESTGILDVSVLLGYNPASILIVNNQGTPASMTLLINPAATLTSGPPPSVCGDGTCDSTETRASCPADCVICGDSICESPETLASCPQDCAICGDGTCSPSESVTNCPQDCGSCGDGICDATETTASCPQDCPACVNNQDDGPCTPTTNCCSGVGNCSGGKTSSRTCLAPTPPSGCLVNLDCDDGNICTTDVCTIGSCEYTNISGCGGCAGNKAECTTDTDCCSNNCRSQQCKGGRRLGQGI